MTEHRPLQVLVCPLKWGLGHATRCVPIVRELLKQGFEVTLAASGGPLAFLKTEFPDLPFIEFPGFSPEYSKRKAMVWHMMKAIPTFLRAIYKEHQRLNEIQNEQEFDVVISDNRYGLWNRKAESILVIHQLTIKAPGVLRWIEPLLWLINKLLMINFNQVWVPDSEGADNLSGDLSHKFPLNKKIRFIGPLSRFTVLSNANQSEKKDGILAIVSGPEPQRSIFQNLLEKQLSTLDTKSTLICGNPSSKEEVRKTGNLTVFPHLDSDSLFRKMQETSLVISRSGYSTLMDMAVVGGKALFIPTPGQTEQEYLARLHQKSGKTHYRNQNETDLEKDIP